MLIPNGLVELIKTILDLTDEEAFSLLAFIDVGEEFINEELELGIEGDDEKED
jgi:ubiquinone biosynthesis protein COQ9